MISAPCKKRHKREDFSLLCKDTVRGCPSANQEVHLTRHQVGQNFDLELPSFQNCEDKNSAVSKPPSLSSPSELRQCHTFIAYNAGDLGSIPGSGRSPGEGNGNPLQHSCLENPMDKGAWQDGVHGVTKNQTRLK